jgi:hypothetical protein
MSVTPKARLSPPPQGGDRVGTLTVITSTWVTNNTAVAFVLRNGKRWRHAVANLYRREGDTWVVIDSQAYGSFRTGLEEYERRRRER